jgi:UDP-GlcNAc3NAcA epimerase
MPLNVITVLGARPQFVKASALSRALAAAGLQEKIIHTGQHYDAGMSGIFFTELGIPEPHWNLGCGGLSQGAMTGAMLTRIERILMDERPDAVVVYGDTNSTLAGALAAVKLHIPVAHVEAGLRSHNRRMPEEINRICTDHVSTLLFCSSSTGADLLATEGVTRGVHITGDVMADVFLRVLAEVRADAALFKSVPGVNALPERFALLTLHRAENTDAPERLSSIFKGISRSPVPIVFPVHPRTLKTMQQLKISLPENVISCEPVGYREMAALVNAAEFILTDSGGLQKEAYWAEKPCVTIRDETEWTETIESGWNTLTGADTGRIIAAVASPPRNTSRPALYGDGQAADRMVSLLKSLLTPSVAAAPVDSR